MKRTKEVRNVSWIICAATAFVFLVWFQSTEAAVSYTVAPLVIDVEAEARDIQTFDITLTNTGTQPVTVYPSVNNISIDEGGTIQNFISPSMSDRTSSLTSWIEITRSGVKLPVGESKTIALTLRVNPFPEPGEYHALIGFGSGRNQHIANQKVKNGAAPGTVMTVNIVEDKMELLRLSRFLIDRFVTSAENESAKYTIENPGDTPLVPNGEVIFYDNRGAEVAAVPVNPDSEAIPPGEEKAFDVTVPTKGLFGKYKAFLSVEYGNTQMASVNDTAFFYVLPIQTLLIILGGILLAVVFGSLYIHKRYIGEDEVSDHDLLHFHIKDTPSDPQEHDIDLKQR